MSVLSFWHTFEQVAPPTHKTQPKQYSCDVFLFTDSHVKDESFLEAVNNMLTIGLVPAIFANEEARSEMI